VTDPILPGEVIYAQAADRSADKSPFCDTFYTDTTRSVGDVELRSGEIPEARSGRSHRAGADARRRGRRAAAGNVHHLSHQLPGNTGVEPGLYDQVDGFFRRRGAYARFKDLLAREGLLDQGYSFEAEYTERALKDWCAANQIEITTEGH